MEQLPEVRSGWWSHVRDDRWSLRGQWRGGASGGRSVAAGALAYYFLTKKGIKQVPIHNHDWKPDIVYLYQFPRSASMPNVSPFCLKVETFLKANKIPYEVRPLLMGRSQYGLLPFIELNGEHIADSQIIIHRLTEHFKTKTLLIPRDEAIARTIDRMTDNHTFLLLCQFKVLSSGTNDFFSMTLSEAGAPKLFIPILAYLFRRKAANRVTGSLGHFSTEDFKMFLKKDYDAYRDLLGDQKFLFGDEINAVDCTVFGTLATALYHPAASYAKDLLKEEYPTLVAYLDRIRDQVFGEEFEKH
nr:Glutathione S-transferase domain containing protein [Haemonchus contortus]